MSDDPWYHITIAASEIKGALPEQFTALLTGFQLLAQKENKAFLAAGAEGVMGAQGRTNLALQIAERLERCFELRKNYQSRA